MEDYEDEEGCIVCGTCGIRKTTNKPYAAGLVSQPFIRCMCDCELREYERKEAEREERNKRQQEIERAKETLLSLDMLRCTFRDSWDNEAIAEAHLFCATFEPKKSDGLMLIGTPGTGKTHAAACIVNELTSLGFRCKMVSAPEIAKMDGGWDRADQISQIAKLDLLVIDDLGTERSTGYVSEQVFRAVDTASRNRVALVITSNLCDLGDDLTAQRIWSRIGRNCKRVEVH